MTTVTLTDARAHLGVLCEKAALGEEVGIISGNQIFLLQPVEVQVRKPKVKLQPWTDSYLSKEYGITAKRLQEIDRKISKESKTKKTIQFSGKFDPRNLE